MRVAEFKPQVFAALVLLTVLAITFAALGQPGLAGVCVGFIGKTIPMILKKKLDEGEE